MTTLWMYSFILASCCRQVAAATVMYSTSPCIQGFTSACQTLHDNVTANVCYGDQIYNLCDFEKLACAGSLPNITDVDPNVNQTACQLIIVVRPPVTTTTTTTQAPSRFEQKLFASAIHGIDDLLDQALANGASVNDTINVFTTQDHYHKHYVRNTNCWAYPLDLTSISPWNSNGKNRKAGTLITPRHALWARHYDMHVNTTIRFVDRNNNVVDRQVTRTKAVPTNGHSFLSGYDIIVAELDSDVPPEISYARVMPKTLLTIRPSSSTRVPVFDTDFEEKALVADLLYESDNMVHLGIPSATSTRRQFYESKIVGDSGNPVFMVIENRPVLMFMFTYGGAGAGTSVTYHYDDINNIIESWGSSYRLTDIDLSLFLDTGDSVPAIIG